MKKIFTLIAAAAMFAVSCQNEITPEKGDSNNPVEGKLTATIVQTKVSYNETSEMNLQPAWEVGDEIIGFDDAGNTYTLTVASVAAETATLNGTVPDGALHLIYKSGASASDISAKALAIDYTAQKGDKTMPAVMLADGTVENGSCNFAFTNAGAIIGISAVNGVPSGSKVTKITISGENLSAATVAISGGALALTATEKADDAISVDGLDFTLNDSDGTLSSPVFIAIPAGAKIAKVYASVAKEPETMKIPSTAADKKGIDYVEIEAKYDGKNLSTKKWAKWNIGANSDTYHGYSKVDYGWYFAWASTEGYIWYAKTWQLYNATSFEFSYALSSVYTAKASDYLYVKSQTFTTTGHSFNSDTTPYHIGSNNKTGWTKYGSSKKPSYWSGDGAPDDKMVLDPEDDAAHVHWGGTWRMPTLSEFQAMKNVTFWANDDVDRTYYVFYPDAKHAAGKVVFDFPEDLDKSSALLCFRATGYALKYELYEFSIRSYEWLSSRSSDTYCDAASSWCGNSSSAVSRPMGYTIRPVSD